MKQNKKQGENELKTLKDLPDFLSLDLGKERTLTGEHWISEEELKAEAVKWIKHLSKTYFNKNGRKEDWIKHFFNLTDEDLK